MKEFLLQKTVSLSKYKYADFTLEHYHDTKFYFNDHFRWERKTDLAGLKWTISIWTYALEITFFADKRIWDDNENKWEEGSEMYFTIDGK